MSSNTRAYLILSVVFLLGSSTGAGAMYAYGRRSQGRQGEGGHGRAHVERRVAALTRELNLSSQQGAEITAILERQRETRSKLMRETLDRCGEPLRKLRADSDAEIHARLNAEQQSKFEVLLRSHTRQNSSP